MPASISSAVKKRTARTNEAVLDIGYALDNHTRLPFDQIVSIPDKLLTDFVDPEFLKRTGRPQPFCEYEGPEFEKLCESIVENGLLHPLLVRPYNDCYQIVAGRHRRRACIRNGYSEISCIIRNMNDEDAMKVAIDTNLRQRPNAKPSEKAYAYRLHRDLNSRQGYRSDLYGEKPLDNLATAGKEDKVSRSTVVTYIHLSDLIPDLLYMVDNKKLSIQVGVILSCYPADVQEKLFTLLPNYGKIKISHAGKLPTSLSPDEVTTTLLDNIFSVPQRVKKIALEIDESLHAQYSSLFDDKQKLSEQFLKFLQSRKGA